MKYPIGTKMRWDNADRDDIYVIDNFLGEEKYIVYVTDKFGNRYLERKEVITEKQLDSIILSIL